MRVDEDNFSENNSDIIYDLDKVCSTGGTSTHLLPRDDLSRHEAREKRKSTISVDLRDGTAKHSIHEFKKRKWYYKSYDKDNEFEQSKHFKLCQKEIELTAEHVLIHQAAYHHALSTIRHPFKEAYEAKAQELINSSENYSEVGINFHKNKHSFPDPINESIWWQKKYMQELENTKMFKNMDFQFLKGNFTKTWLNLEEEDPERDIQRRERNLPNEGFFGRERYPDNQESEADVQYRIFRAGYKWPGELPYCPETVFEHREDLKTNFNASRDEANIRKKLIDSLNKKKLSSSGGGLGNPGMISRGTPNIFKSSSSGGVPSSFMGGEQGYPGMISMGTPTFNPSSGGGSGNPGMTSMGTPRVNRSYSSLPNPVISTMPAAPVPNSTYKNLYQNQPNISMPHSKTQQNAFVYQVPELRSVNPESVDIFANQVMALYDSHHECQLRLWVERDPLIYRQLFYNFKVKNVVHNEEEFLLLFGGCKRVRS